MADQKVEPLTIPETLTLNGTEFKVLETPELKAFIEDLRKKISVNEKSKLYSQIEDLKNGIETLKKVEVKSEPTAQQNGNLKEEILGELKKYLEPIVRKTDFAQATSVATYRNQLLEQNQGKCFPELVVGDSKEKLDEALAASTKLWDTHNMSEKNPVIKETPNTEVTEKVVAPVEKTVEKKTALPEVKKTVALDPDNEVDINNMSMDDFGKNRAALEAKIKTLVAN